jgi:hypothetical protein
LRLRHISPVKYLKSSSFDRQGNGYNSQKIRNFLEDYNGGYLVKRVAEPNKRKPVPSAIDDYNQKRLNQSIWVASTKRKQEAHSFHPEEDKQARRRARIFLNKIRELGLVELPKISYFDKMIQQNCKKEEPPERRKRHSNQSVGSRLSMRRSEESQP